MSDKTKAELQEENKALKAQVKNQEGTIAAQADRIRNLETKVADLGVRLSEAKSRAEYLEGLSAWDIILYKIRGVRY